MSVKSARVQKVVKGDTVTLRHQIMEDKAYDAELSRAPVLVDSGDVVKCFYALEDEAAQDLIGFLASPVGSLPSSEIDVLCLGDIPASGNDPERGTNTWKAGLGQTVRVEITRYLTGYVETHYLFQELDVFERGFPASESDTTGGASPPAPTLNLP